LGKVTNFEYGNFDIEKFNFENCKFEFEFNFELDWGGGLLMMIGDAMTPFDPRFDPILVFFFRSYIISNFEITSFEVPVFEITLLYLFYFLQEEKNLEFLTITRQGCFTSLWVLLQVFQLHLILRENGTFFPEGAGYRNKPPISTSQFFLSLLFLSL